MLQHEQRRNLEIVRTARTGGQQPFVQLFGASLAVVGNGPALTAFEQTHEPDSKKTGGEDNLPAR